MRRLAVVVWLSVSAGLPSTVAAGDGPGPAPAGPVLLLPAGAGPSRLRLDVTIDGRDPAAARDAFLDRLFDHSDRNGDGVLSRDEASRMVPLPLPGHKELPPDFARLDANGDGKGSRAEWRAFCQAGGFAPVVVVVEPPSADDLRLADLLSRRLDSDGDGKFTRAELQRAPRSFRAFDLNDDEFLDLAELLSAAGPRPPDGKTEVMLGGPRTQADATLRVDVGTKAPAARIIGEGGRLTLLPPAGKAGPHRLHAVGWSATFQSTHAVPDVGSAAEFLASQMRTALGDRPALAKAEVEQDPTLSGLTELFRYADRNGDGKLSLAELEGYLELVEMGVRSQVWIRVSDRGRNPFPALDADGDGRLSYQELTRAADVLAGSGTRPALPRQFEFTFGGPAVASWGGVSLPAVSRRARPRKIDTSGTPRWFQAMDRNGDGVVSPREFVGPPEAFRKLDADGDGVISPEEAARADSR